MFKGKRFRSALSVIMLSLLLTVFTFPEAALAAKGSGGTTTTTTTRKSYVALGDSIATGTVTNWSRITSYVTYFYQFLQTQYGSKNVTLTNLAHDGDRSTELLAKLKSDPIFIRAVTNADVITISIGGNNLMQAAAIPGFTDINWTLADQGVADFNDQWDDIILRIRFLNKKNAQIIVNTVYNPYNLNPPSGYSADNGLHVLTDQRLVQINNTINSNAVTSGYKVADVYTAFDEYSESTMGKITYFYPSLWSYVIRNPHPNATGQTMITDAVKAVFTP